jgi:hypothetical protein
MVIQMPDTADVKYPGEFLHLELTDKDRPLFDPIKDELQRRYREEWSNMDDTKVFYLILDGYDAWLQKNVCLINGYKAGGCAELALLIAKEGMNGIAARPTVTVSNAFSKSSVPHTPSVLS